MTAHIDTPDGVLIPIPGSTLYRHVRTRRAATEAPISDDERALLSLHAQCNQLQAALTYAHQMLKAQRAHSKKLPNEHLDGAINVCEETLQW